jgi:hypothetical protein
MKQARKAHQRLAFVPVPKACTNKHDINFCGCQRMLGKTQVSDCTSSAVYLYMQYMNIVRKYHVYLYKLLGTGTKANL